MEGINGFVTAWHALATKSHCHVLRLVFLSTFDFKGTRLKVVLNCDCVGGTVGQGVLESDVCGKRVCGNVKRFTCLKLEMIIPVLIFSLHLQVNT